MTSSYDEYHSQSYYGGHSASSMDDYLERINKMQRTPTMIPDFPAFPNVHKVLKNNLTHGEKHGHHHKTHFHANHPKHHVSKEHKEVHSDEHEKHKHHVPKEHKKVHSDEHAKHKHHVPKEHKKVHLDEHEETTEIAREKPEKYELRKWASIKVY